LISPSGEKLSKKEKVGSRILIGGVACRSLFNIIVMKKDSAALLASE
jgi:hypothetical protein